MALVAPKSLCQVLFDKNDNAALKKVENQVLAEDDSMYAEISEEWTKFVARFLPDERQRYYHTPAYPHSHAQLDPIP